MGKSPGKWIKTLLFGKKTTRSHSMRRRNASKAGIDKGYTVDKGSPTSENSPVISKPVLVTTYNNEINPELDKGNDTNLGADTTSLAVPANRDAEDQGIAGPVTSNNPEIFKEEQAAIKVQAAFRGFLARRAFQTLKGIIRLQALVRGHLVRRQAFVTLRSMVEIIKLQALFRSQKLRSSGHGLEVNTEFDQGSTVVYQQLGLRKGKLYTSTFVCKLLSSSLVVMPLRIQYDQDESNSVPNWMERWTFSRFWITPPQPKRTSESKSQAKRSSYTMETESGRSKRSVRRSSPVVADVGPPNATFEPEKPKRNVKKVSASAVSVQDHPQSELEKVKRNLRKVSGSLPETSDKLEIGPDTQHCGIRKEGVDSPSDNLEQGTDESQEKTKKDIAFTPEIKRATEVEGTVDQLVENSLSSTDKEENVPVLNGELSVKEEQTCTDNQKTSKRRASFSAKTEYTENGSQNTPTLPSYMQATESAKAKLRGLNSPRLGSDSAEKNETTRRHSLPSSMNGKINSYSPRTQKIVQATGKGGGFRSDRSLLSSRDGNEKLIQVEWRR